jgi:hypothetical protein
MHPMVSVANALKERISPIMEQPVKILSKTAFLNLIPVFVLDVCIDTTKLQKYVHPICHTASILIH